MKTPETIGELYIYMEGEFKATHQKINDLNNVDEKLDKHTLTCTADKEIREHKENHWKSWGVMIGITGIVFTAIGLIVKYV